MRTQPIKPIKKETTVKKHAILPLIIVIVVFLLIVTGFVAYRKIQAEKLESAYQEAVNAKESGDYGVAVILFTELGDYRDSANMIQECYDLQYLEKLQSMYQAIDTVYQIDKDLVNIVSTAIKNVDTINSAGTKLRATISLAISSLYSGQGHQAYE